MEKLNMANMNTLIMKGYLLAGVMMTSNMFIVNEVRAMDSELNKEEKNLSTSAKDKLETNNGPEKNQKENEQEKDLIKEYDISKDKNTEQKIEIENSFYIGPCKYIGFLLQWENTINLVGGELFTLANSFYKFYENKPSFYFDWLFAGWNSNPFAKGYLQFCPNINLGRGIFWLVMYYAQDRLMHTFYKIITEKLVNEKVQEKVASDFANGYLFLLFGEYTPFVIENKLVKNMEYANRFKFYGFIKSLLRLVQNFVSVPLIIHLTSKLTISIAFDAIMWMVVSHFVIDDRLKNYIESLKNNKTLSFPSDKKKE